jgi:DNA-directed RNA polymerase subunit RPC12/RpoP
MECKKQLTVKHFVGNAESIDMVEVVRCKYCKHYNLENLECNIKFDSSGEKLTMDYHHYCSDGKRRK